MKSKTYRVDRMILWAVIALESVLFSNFYFREIAWSPPLMFDQAEYLTEAYRLQERVLANGPGQLVGAIWSNGHSTGLALPIEGAFSGLILGRARLSQLCVLFAAFVALQIVAFTTAQAIWHRSVYSYMLLGLILCQTSAWFWAGGLFDFRIDFFAYCFYGIWACAVLRSKLFLERRWAIISGLIGAFLVLNRFLTIVYLVGLGIGFAAVCVALKFRWRKNGELAARISRRFHNLALSFIFLAVVVAPVFYLNRAAVYGYYVVGHSVSDEKFVRAREFGVAGSLDNLLFYPKSLLNDHLGQIFLWASAIAIASGLLVHLAGGTKVFLIRGSGIRDETPFLQVVFLLGAIVGPIIALTTDTSKSPVVAGIVSVPVALLVIALTVALAATGEEFSDLPIHKALVACSVVIICLGLFNQFDHASRHLPEYTQRDDLKELAELDKWLVEYSDARGWHKPAVSFDVITSWFISQAITASGYEQLGKLVEFHQMLPPSIMGVDRTEAISLLSRSDFFILTTLEKAGVYPFYKKIAKYWDDLRLWADENMFVEQTVQFNGFTATIYVRPNAKISGLSGNWITSAGLDIETQQSALKRFPRVRLAGSGNRAWLPQIPNVTATVDQQNNSGTIPASLRLTDNQYEILVDTSPLNLPSSGPVRIHLNFNAFFVPKDMGVNEDTRKLVLPAPSLIQLEHAP